MRKLKVIILSICGMLPVFCMAQSLEEVIKVAQDSAITAFQSRYEFESYQAQNAAFEALRKPQLTLQFTPNYQRVVSDPSRDYVYLRNFDRFSTSAQLKLTQKMLNLGGEAYVGTQALWSEYFAKDKNVQPRDFVATPIIFGYRQSLLGYNPFRWEKVIEDQRLKAARQQHNYELNLIAEETTRRYFRLVCAQGIYDMCERNLKTADTLYAIAQEKASIAMVTLAELRSLELQRLNAANALETARNDQQVALEYLLSYLRINEDEWFKMVQAKQGNELFKQSRPTIIFNFQSSILNNNEIEVTADEALQMARANDPAFQHRLTSLLEARQQQQKALKESGINVGLDVNVGLQQVSQNFGNAYKNQQVYMLGAVSVSIPLMDHGAAKKRLTAATAWTAREEQALEEAERALSEDVITTLENLRSHRNLLQKTAQAVTMADEVFQLNADNYANGLCDINTYSLAQSRRDNAYNQHLNVLEKYWTTYYHLLTLIQHE